MMKKVRVLVCLIFVLSCIVFGAYTVKTQLTQDKNAPVITFESDEVQVSVKTATEDMMTGVSASDQEDGDLTEQIQIVSMSRIMSGGIRTVEYVVFDSANNFDKAERTIVYTDYVSPKIYFTEPLRYTENSFEMGEWPVQATDVLDGDLTSKVRYTVNGMIDPYVPDKYSVTFLVNNSAGDTRSIDISVEIVDEEGEKERYYPVLSNYVVYTSVGKNIKTDKYVTGLENRDTVYEFGSEVIAGISAANVTIKSNVDYQTPGVYTVEYSYTTRNGVTATTTLYVVVEE